MRHRLVGRELSRTSAHRLALRRNLAASLIEHETISTTIQKAKEVKPFVEKLITLARKGNLQSRRRAISLLGNRRIVAYEDGEPVRKGTVVGKLFSELGPRYLERAGGYARIIHLALRRQGDNGQLVLLQLLAADEPLKRQRKTGDKKRRRKGAKPAGKAQAAEAGGESSEGVGASTEAPSAEAEAMPAGAAQEAEKTGRAKSGQPRGAGPKSKKKS